MLAWVNEACSKKNIDLLPSLDCVGNRMDSAFDFLAAATNEARKCSPTLVKH